MNERDDLPIRQAFDQLTPDDAAKARMRRRLTTVQDAAGSAQTLGAPADRCRLRRGPPRWHSAAAMAENAVCVTLRSHFRGTF